MTRRPPLQARGYLESPRARGATGSEGAARHRHWRWLSAGPALFSALGLAAVLLAGAAGVASAQPESPSRESERRTVVQVFAPRGATGARCDRVYPLERSVATPAVLTGAMRALVAGPTATERTRGYGGWFSPRTAGSVRSVRIARGVAYVDFRDFSHLIPGASSSCGSALLLAQLDRTALQFPTVRRTAYSFDGSRRAFYEWLQREPPA